MECARPASTTYSSSSKPYIEQNNSRQSSLEGTEASSGAKGEELARCLQRELVRARLHAAEREAAERELTARITELENENKSLRRQRVDNNVAHLQVMPRSRGVRVCILFTPGARTDTV